MTSRFTHMLQHRRGFLQLGAAGFFGLTLPRLLAAETNSSSAPVARAKNMILIWLDGGPATIDMWDPKPDAPDYIRGEFSTIATAVPDLRIGEHLPKMAAVMDRCTLVRSFHHTIPDHGPGSQYVLTGQLPSAATEYPSLGSITARLLPSTTGIPTYIAFQNPVAGGAGYLGSACNPFELSDSGSQLPPGLSLGDKADRSAFTSHVQLRRRLDRRFDAFNHDPVAHGLDAYHRQAVDVLQQDSVRLALNLESVPQDVRDRFGSRSTLGATMLRVCRLIEAGARFVTVSMSGWDTHANNFAQLRNTLLPQLDQALSALVTHMESSGLLSSTIVCCCGEFARTPEVNGNAGRDHWSRAASVLLAGGGFKAGHVHGATDTKGLAPIEGSCTPGDLTATLLHQLGIPITTKLAAPSGREFAIIRDGRVIQELS